HSLFSTNTSYRILLRRRQRGTRSHSRRGQILDLRTSHSTGVLRDLRVRSGARRGLSDGGLELPTARRQRTRPVSDRASGHRTGYLGGDLPWRASTLVAMLGHEGGAASDRARNRRGGSATSRGGTATSRTDGGATAQALKRIDPEAAAKAKLP